MFSVSQTSEFAFLALFESLVNAAFMNYISEIVKY